MTDHLQPENWPAWATESVEIVEHNPEWSSQALEEIQQLRDSLQHLNIHRFEHIGSTSIPGLPAKPIIDLMGEVQSWDHMHIIAEHLNPIEWNYVPPELDGREYRRFWVRVKDGKRAVHLHLMRPGEERWNRQVQFRDVLRQRPDLVEAYAALKAKLADENKDDREAYTAAKTEFILQVLDEGI
ncbi:GrpB family protein [Paenibacillus pabuli]|uniref:GrpB family protein n=1 Tax=Paenibacillus pabuli TaxID=1472 RepID=UPI000781113C|nr:GrpB family protein [Paenibacillus pabuli]MEC0126088.1 GrpB family protein [Paenibacillus pabuli]